MRNVGKEDDAEMSTDLNEDHQLSGIEWNDMSLKDQITDGNKAVSKGFAAAQGGEDRLRVLGRRCGTEGKECCPVDLVMSNGKKGWRPAKVC